MSWAELYFLPEQFVKRRVMEVEEQTANKSGVVGLSRRRKKGCLI